MAQRGEARKNRNGFVGSGFKFTEDETTTQQDMESLDKKEFEVRATRGRERV